MPIAQLERLEAWKTRFGSPDVAPLTTLLRAAAKWRLRDSASLIRLHETALFLRAWPASRDVARLADAILFSFAERVSQLPEDERAAFSAPEIAGIAGTSLTAVFSHAVVRSLAQRYGRNVEIEWDCYDDADRIGPLLARLLPLMAEEWPVEAHVPYGAWIAAVRERGETDLEWLLARARAEEFDAVGVPVTWGIGDARSSRSRMRLPTRSVYCHTQPLMRRQDVSLETELESPPLEVRRVSRPESHKVLEMILDTSAMRYRELYGFSHPDERRVFHAPAGRGVDIYFFGVPSPWRLPVRAYHAGMFFKNGVPAGYIELLSFFDRAETGFNLYYTFREGETAWLYARLLRLFRQVLGVNCFSVDPYQIGLENPEAIDSGAFWFYRKLGFRPVNAVVAALTAREEKRMRETPGYRSSKRTLEKLAADCLIYEGPGAETGAWDRFRIRRLGLGLTAGGLASVMNRISDFDKWTHEERSAAAEILRAKEKASEAQYLKLMQRHSRLRASLLALGSAD
jgi:hypothetical protein